MKRISISLAAVAMLLLFIAGCAKDSHSEYDPKEPITQFSNEDWATVLGKVATPDGYVKWGVFQANEDRIQDALLRYVALLAKVSPENRPDLFSSGNEHVAYYINAYNALCIANVIKANYFWSPAVASGPVILGGNAMTLDQVMAKLRWFGDPRVHFALNNCTRSAPPLRSLPYDGVVLNAELIDQGHLYLGDPRAAIRDGDIVKLNDIFTKLYTSDFIDAFKAASHKHDAGLLESLAPYALPESPITGASNVSNLGYDNSLNRPPR